MNAADIHVLKCGISFRLRRPFLPLTIRLHPLRLIMFSSIPCSIPLGIVYPSRFRTNEASKHTRNTGSLISCIQWLQSGDDGPSLAPASRPTIVAEMAGTKFLQPNVAGHATIAVAGGRQLPRVEGTGLAGATRASCAVANLQHFEDMDSF